MKNTAALNLTFTLGAVLALSNAWSTPKSGCPNFAGTYSCKTEFGSATQTEITQEACANLASKQEGSTLNFTIDNQDHATNLGSTYNAHWIAAKAAKIALANADGQVLEVKVSLRSAHQYQYMYLDSQTQALNLIGWVEGSPAEEIQKNICTPAR